MRQRPASRARGITTAATLALFVGAAGCADDAAAERPTCAGAVAEAAAEIEPADQVRGLDDALRWCGSYDAYVGELARYPGLLGYSPETYVERRCAALDDVRLRLSPTCRIARPATTPAPSTVPDIVYAAATLDGRVVALRPSPAVPFTGDVPAAVQDTVDIAVAEGCPGVLAQRDRWAAEAASEQATAGAAVGPAAADIASAYAQHAIHVALWIGCENAELAPGGATSSVGASVEE